LEKCQQNEQQMSERANHPGNLNMRSYPRHQALPEREFPAIGTAGLRHLQPEEGSEVVWETVQGERELTRCFAAGVASKSFLPTEAIVRPLATCEDRRRCGRLDLRNDGFLHVQLLVAYHLDASPPLFPAWPVTPEQRG